MGREEKKTTVKINLINLFSSQSGYEIDVISVKSSVLFLSSPKIPICKNKLHSRDFFHQN